MNNRTIQIQQANSQPIHQIHRQPLRVSSQAIRPSDVFVTSQEYQRSHGKMPRGFGSWAFFPYDSRSFEDAIWATATFAAAKRIAQKAAAARGIRNLNVGS